MRWLVLESGIPADRTNYPHLSPGWDKAIFETEEEARKYARIWLYKAGLKDLVEKLEINQAYDYTGFGDTIEIRSIP